MLIGNLEMKDTPPVSKLMSKCNEEIQFHCEMRKILIMDMFKQVVIIIGLPGSGKSHYAVKTFPQHTIHDDFLRHFYNGLALEQITKNEKVCLIDPRLSVFTNIINRIIATTDISNIKVILFENSPEMCLTNINYRENHMRDHRDGLIQFIDTYNLSII